MRFERKIVLVTGASRGLGRAIALEFASEGADVAVHFHKFQEGADKTVNEICSMGRRAIAVQGDISDEKAVDSIYKNSVDALGPIDIAIHNAALVADTPLLERSGAQWKSILDVNLLGTFLCLKAAAKHMRENERGAIVNISSTSGIYAFCDQIIDYDVSKAAILTLTKHFARALAPYNVRVNSLAPGWVDTDSNKELDKGFLNKEREKIYLGRFAETREIAKIVQFLASPDASYINGTTIVADGGHD